MYYIVIGYGVMIIGNGTIVNGILIYFSFTYNPPINTI
jgi:hypothetical protein